MAAVITNHNTVRNFMNIHDTFFSLNQGIFLYFCHLSWNNLDFFAHDRNFRRAERSSAEKAREKGKCAGGFVCLTNGNDIRQYGRVASHVSSHRAKQRNRQLMNCLHHSAESIKQLAPVTRENPHTRPRLPAMPPLSHRTTR